MTLIRTWLDFALQQMAAVGKKTGTFYIIEQPEELGVA